ncbi:MAG: hypothetical protein JXB62_18055 [Pirellulales bacterium]|nr:hypothetical protein [Pirellulales bacterium]
MLRTGTTIPAALVCAMLVFDGVSMAAPPPPSKDFRIENKVFSRGQKAPLNESTTIFHNGVVYDYLEDPEEVIVFEKAAGRFVLLDMSRRVRAEVTTREVEGLTKRLQELAERQADPFYKFLAAPKFTERYNGSTGELTLSSPWMTYRMILSEIQSPPISQQYREFCDWYARLNTLLNPGSKPPTARLAVNEALARHNATPREVFLTMTPKKTFPPHSTKLRSEHHLVDQVAQADLIRVQQTRQFMGIFQVVSFEQYRGQDGP